MPPKNCSPPSCRVSDLLGRARLSAPVYGGDGFTSYDDERLTRQLAGWVEQDGCAAVKMKIGGRPDDGPRRVRVAKGAIGDATLFVDSNGAYGVKQALRMADVFAAEADVRWFEEPVSSDDLDGLAQVRAAAPARREVPAGEYAYNLDDLRRMLSRRAIDVQQVDASRCLGVTGFFAAGALCDVHHIDLSGHSAPALHLHAACSPFAFPLSSHRLANARPTGGACAALTLLGASAALGAPAAARGTRGSAHVAPQRSLDLPASPEADARGAVKAARRLNRAAGALATSVLLDSAMEHYRGAFASKAMYTPLVVSSLAIVASWHGHGDRASSAHRLRDAVYALTLLTGAAGTAFHLYNITNWPGGFSWRNLFYAAPLGATAAISLSGMAGYLAERVRDNPPGTVPRVLGAPAGRIVSALTSVGLFGTTAEAALLHFRGAFHNPAMFLPVTVPPGAAVLLMAAAAGKAGRRRPVTLWWLRFTAWLGLIGVGFRTVGVARNMGGWRNWRQNLQAWPPLPAPPSFSGLALAGLVRLGLLHDNPDV